jgi:hypothetical protein
MINLALNPEKSCDILFGLLFCFQDLLNSSNMYRLTLIRLER